MRRDSTKIGIEEVAREARVSMATVSRVANGSHSVTPRLRARVYKASVKLGYDLDGKNKSKIIAFILSNRAVLHPFHSAVLVGAEAYCAAHDYGLLFLPVRYPSDVSWKELHLPQVLHRHDVIRGAIVAGLPPKDRAMLYPTPRRWMASWATAKSCNLVMEPKHPSRFGNESINGSTTCITDGDSEFGL